MSLVPAWQLYSGRGTVRDQALPLAADLDVLTKPAGYIADEGVSAAVNVALALGQPLLVTGEPGTGKTQLAHSIAYELGLQLLIFNTKTTSSSRDLFYRYDALQHFQNARIHGDGEASDMDTYRYIDFEALGQAILLAMDPAEANPFLPEGLRNKGPRRSVVLVDEIDKAPRDFPNDILNEVEDMRFTVRETGREFAASREYRPIVVLTSNSEKNLPDAFLRRCVYYHVPVPGKERLEEIVARRLGVDQARTTEGSGNGKGAIVHNAVEHFVALRDRGLKKGPATAELISWVRMLLAHDLDMGQPLDDARKKTLLESYSILAKTREDLAVLRGERAAAR